jgi:L-fuconolactonase
MTIIDGHLHAFVPVSSRYPRASQPLFPPDLAAPVEALLADMELAGVDQAVLVGLSPHDAYLAECLRRFPGTFGAILVHRAGEGEADALNRIENAGARGLRFMGLDAAGTADPHAVPSFGVLRTLAAEGHVCWLYPAAADLPVLPGLLSELDDLQVVLNHLGFCMADDLLEAVERPAVAGVLPPPTLEEICGLARFPGVHVMVSGQYAFSHEPHPHLDVAPVTRRLHETFGAARLLWASDWPWIRHDPGYAAQLELVDVHLPHLTPDERTDVVGGTVGRLLDL